MAALVTASLLSRLPIGINGLAIVLFLRAETGSFAVAGAAAGALALGNGLGGPLSARRGRPARVPRAHAHGGRACGRARRAVRARVADAAAGARDRGCVRLPAWRSRPRRRCCARCTRGSLRDHEQGAYALDSVITESIFVAGPLLMGLLVALVAPGAALVVSAGVVLVGTVCVRRRAAGRRRAALRGRRARDWLGALRAPGIRTLVAAMVPVGFAFGVARGGAAGVRRREGLARARRAPDRDLVDRSRWPAGSSTARGAQALARGVHLRVALLLPLGFVPIVLADSMRRWRVLVIPGGRVRSRR